MTPRAKQVLGTVAIGAGTAAVIVAIVEVFEVRRLRRLSRFPHLPPPTTDDPNLGPDPTPGLLDIDDEGDPDPEPEGIVYDDDEPCVIPPHPWEAPVAASPFGPKVGEGAGCVPPADLEPLQKTEVPFAVGSETPAWPVPADKKMRVSYEDVRDKWHGRWGRNFGATRTSTDKATGEKYKRVHVGVDLFADDGDVVHAMEDGEVLATLPYYKDTSALYVLNDSGLIVNYGEIRNNSWREFGIKTGIETGQRITKGQPIARVGVSNDGSHMLHVETFAPETTVDDIRRGHMRWIAGEPAPANVLDPTRYLVLARQAAIEGIT